LAGARRRRHESFSAGAPSGCAVDIAGVVRSKYRILPAGPIGVSENRQLLSILPQTGTANSAILRKTLRPVNCLPDSEVRVKLMVVAGGLGVLVLFCLLLSMVQKPPAIGR
jgi:hypothetical protein